MLHQVPRFLAMRRGAFDAKVAFLVFDGLAMDQWVQIREHVTGLAPRGDLRPFADRGAELLGEVEASAVPALCWGMAISAYPFFGKVAELTGRLTSIQGDCASKEVHRRMAETYGERETAYRAANRVIQSQADWGALERVGKGRRIIRRPPMNVSHDGLIAWLIEAALRYTGKAMSVATLESSAVLYPFSLDQPLAFVASKSPALELRADGSRAQNVAIGQLR